MYGVLVIIGLKRSRSDRKYDGNCLIELAFSNSTKMGWVKDYFTGATSHLDWAA